MKIRIAKKDDFKAIDNLYQNLMGYLYDLKPYFMKGPGHFNLTEKMYIEWLADEEQTVFVAETKGVVVGFVNCAIKEAKENDIVKSFTYVEIDNIVIDKDYKKNGIGKKLMEKAEEWAKKNNINTVRLGARGTNYDALDFYKHLGYEISSVIFHKDI